MPSLAATRDQRPALCCGRTECALPKRGRLSSWRHLRNSRCKAVLSLPKLKTQIEEDKSILHAFLPGRTPPLKKALGLPGPGEEDTRRIPTHRLAYLLSPTHSLCPKFSATENSVPFFFILSAWLKGTIDCWRCYVSVKTLCKCGIQSCLSEICSFSRCLHYRNPTSVLFPQWPVYPQILKEETLFPSLMALPPLSWLEWSACNTNKCPVVMVWIENVLLKITHWRLNPQVKCC